MIVLGGANQPAGCAGSGEDDFVFSFVFPKLKGGVVIEFDFPVSDSEERDAYSKNVPRPRGIQMTTILADKEKPAIIETHPYLKFFDGEAAVALTEYLTENIPDLEL